MAWTKEDAERLMRGEVQGRKISAPMILVKPEIKPFKSHVDGSIITTRRQLHHHNLRNDVVNVEEFKGFWEEKAKERAKIFDPEEAKKDPERKKDIIEAVNRLEGEAK